MFTSPPHRDNDRRKQNSIKSLIMYHIGDKACNIMGSDFWESFFNTVVPEEHQYPSFFGNEHRGRLFDDSLLNRLTMLKVFNDLPLSNRLDVLAVTIIDNYLVAMYQNAMSWSYYYDKESKVWGTEETSSECIRKLFRERWFNEPYQEEEEEEGNDLYTIL
jgi:hypothetical protein